VTYRIRFTKLAAKDVQKLSPKLQQKLKEILRNRVAIDPYCGKPLVGELKGFYSIRLSFKDRIIYSIHDDELLIVVVRARTHYGE
jgi:addiction module RelE/StbE family toxin